MFLENLRAKLGFPGGSVGNLPAMQETCVRSQGWADPLEKEMTWEAQEENYYLANLCVMCQL